MPGMKTFIERHAPNIVGTLSCFDRVVIMETLPATPRVQGEDPCGATLRAADYHPSSCQASSLTIMNYHQP